MKLTRKDQTILDAAQGAVDRSYDQGYADAMANTAQEITTLNIRLQANKDAYSMVIAELRDTNGNLNNSLRECMKSLNPLNMQIPPDDGTIPQ